MTESSQDDGPLPLLCLVAAPLVAAIDAIPFWGRGMFVIVLLLLPIYICGEDGGTNGRAL